MSKHRRNSGVVEGGTGPLQHFRWGIEYPISPPITERPPPFSGETDVKIFPARCAREDLSPFPQNRTQSYASDKRLSRIVALHYLELNEINSLY